MSSSPTASRKTLSPNWNETVGIPINEGAEVAKRYYAMCAHDSIAATNEVTLRKAQLSHLELASRDSELQTE